MSLAVVVGGASAFAVPPRGVANARPRASLRVPSNDARRGRTSDASLRAALSFPRGGAVASDALASVAADPSKLYNTAFGGLVLVAAAARAMSSSSSSDGGTTKREKPAAVAALQRRFLSVFWLLRCADWLQGPYFYDVYKSKVFDGVPASLGLVSRIFVAGFASTAIFGPSVGRFADQSGRKKGTLAFCALYTLGALSTKSSLLSLVFLGRLVNGVGTSLLFSAPEAWLVGESQRTEGGGDWLGETFGLAYAGDSVVAILAGKLSGAAASRRGPTGPFELSTVCLALGALFTAFLWRENVATVSPDADDADAKPSIRDAIDVIRSDSKIMLVGATQALFEAAMYIFVLQWPPVVTAAINNAFPAAVGGTPYGTIFSCFMACCLLGSTVFGRLVNDRGVAAEDFSSGMLWLAAAAMAAAATASSSVVAGLAPKTILAASTAAFFVFEACVGAYFPSVGTLRGRHVPDSHRSVIMNLFGIPLNVLVVAVFLLNERLGVTGALGIAAGALSLAAVCGARLVRATRRGDDAAAAATA